MRHPIALVIVALVFALTGVAEAQDEKGDTQPTIAKKIVAAPQAPPHELGAHWTRDGAGAWRLEAEQGRGRR
jgi:hypothetical protein